MLDFLAVSQLFCTKPSNPMKKIFASIGVVALGAAAVHGESAAMMGTGADNTKSWSVGARLRGFYDDNYTTAPNDVKRESFGASIRDRKSVV